MAVYKVKAVVNRTGQVIRNKMTDTSKQNIIARLKTTGLTPISIEKETQRKLPSIAPKQEKKNKVSAISTERLAEMKSAAKRKKEGGIATQFASFKRIQYQDIRTFTQSLLLLKKANFTNVRALSTLLENTENPNMKEIVEDILNGVEAGEYIYSTMEYYSKVFPAIYVSIVKVGELSGSLTNSLEQALKYLEDSTKIKKDVKKAVMGPLLQSGGLLGLSVIAIIVGLPIMKDLYGQLGVEDQIPKATLAAADFISMLGQYWYLTFGIIAALVFGFIYWKQTPAGKYKWDYFKLTMPVFGQLILKLQLQKFFTALDLNLANHARLQDAIEVSKGVTSNDVLLAAFEEAQSNLQVGESWIAPFEKMPFFPSMMLEMLKIGMETDIVSMITKLVEFIEQDITITIEKVIKALPEISNCVMGVILIGFVLIILKPIMEVYLGGFLFDAYGM